MRIVVASILTVILSVCAAAQTLNLYNIDATGYPTIRADYVAVDTSGNRYYSLTTADFRVVERMTNNQLVDVSATIKHRCVQATTDSAVRLLIILDESGSMKELFNGVPRVEIAKSAIQQLLAQLDLTNGSEVCLMGFSVKSRMICSWSSDPAELLDSLGLISVATLGKGTHYEEPLLGIPNMFEEFKKRDQSISKVAIFITDGQPQPPPSDVPTFINLVTSKANEQSIVMHSVTINAGMPYAPLEQICSLTSGTSASGADDRVAVMIGAAGSSAFRRESCFLEWVSPLGCGFGDLQRTAVATLLRGSKPSVETDYTSNMDGTVIVESSTRLLEVGNPVPGEYSEASVTFTAVNTDLKVRGFAISPSTQFEVTNWDYPAGFVNPPSPTNILTFRKGIPRTLRIRYRQPQSPSVQTAELSLLGDVCSISQHLRAGGPRVVVVTPNGGEVLSTCDTTIIRWSGVPADAPVRIQWSADGVVWNEIANAATGLSYRWAPTAKGDTYRIRITYTPPSHHMWMQHIGAAGVDTVSSVAISPSADKGYITGWFTGSTQFGDGIVSYLNGAADGFCQEVDSNGNLGRTILVTGGDLKNEKIIGAVTDSKGNLYLAGTFQSASVEIVGATNKKTLTMPVQQGVSDVSDMFLIKIKADGFIDWARCSQGNLTTIADVTATSLGLMLDSKGQPQIVVAGTYENFINIGTTKDGKPIQFGPGDSYGQYYAIYDQFGTPISLTAGTPPTGYRYASKRSDVVNGCYYEADHFTGVVTREVFSATSHGSATDAFIVRHRIGESAVDESNATFVVSTPQLSLSPTTLTLPPAVVNGTSTQVFTRHLCNTDKYPARISDLRITGEDAGEFTLVSSVAGKILKPGQCIDLEFKFRPTAEGPRTATFHVVDKCGDLATGTLEGIGMPGCNLSITDVVRFQSISIGSITPTTLCLLRNNTDSNLTLSVHVEPIGSGFDINPKGPVTLSRGSCFVGTITYDATVVTPGIHEASVVYDLPSKCGLLSTEVVATVLDQNPVPKDTALEISNVEWPARRLRTVHDSVIYLRNSGEVDVTIESLSYGATNGDITADFASIPATPFVLHPSDFVVIPVRFDPTRRGEHTTEILAFASGFNAPLKGLARGIGILPVITATGDQWSGTPIFTFATKTGNVVIRNTDPTTPLLISDVVFEDPTQADFVWTTTSGIVFPYFIAPNESLSIPVRFIPQASGNRSTMVRIYHDAKEGPDPLPPYAATSVELLGIGEINVFLDPIEFPPTLTCEESELGFFIANPSKTESMFIENVRKSDSNNVFYALGSQSVVVPPDDSVEIRVGFAPSDSRLYTATFVFENSMVPGLHITMSGQGITTTLVASMSTGQNSAAGEQVTIPLTVQPQLPFYSGLERFNIELGYPEKSLEFKGVQTALGNATISSTDHSIPGRVVIVVDVAGAFVQDLGLSTAFRTLLSSDTTVNITTNVSTGYRCVTSGNSNTVLAVVLPCAGFSRVINLGANAFGLAQPYPSPASDKFSVRYSTGLKTATTFDIIDAIGDVVLTTAIQEQPSGTYELDVALNTIAAGAYVLRMSAGHYVESRTFTVVR